MGKYPKLISIGSFILYIILNYFFVTFASTHQIAGLSEEFKEINEMLSNSTSLLEIITILTLITTIIAVLAQYIIGKFLLIIFKPGIKTYLYYALAPKVLIFIGVFQIYNAWLYQITALIGAFLIILFIQYKKNNWTVALLFSAIFLIDPLYSLGKSLYSSL